MTLKENSEYNAYHFRLGYMGAINEAIRIAKANGSEQTVKDLEMQLEYWKWSRMQERLNYVIHEHNKELQKSVEKVCGNE